MKRCNKPATHYSKFNGYRLCADCYQYAQQDNFLPKDYPTLGNCDRVIEEKPVTKKFQVIDSQTHQVIGTYSSRIRASRRCDQLDLEYGAIRYYVRPVFVHDGSTYYTTYTFTTE